MAGLQTLLQAFPNLGCFCPRISKESLGGFVGFQEVTRVKNPKSPFPNFFAALALLLASFQTPAHRIPSLRAIGVRARSRLARDCVAGGRRGVFMAAGSGPVERYGHRGS